MTTRSAVLTSMLKSALPRDERERWISFEYEAAIRGRTV